MGLPNEACYYHPKRKKRVIKTLPRTTVVHRCYQSKWITSIKECRRQLPTFRFSRNGVVVGSVSNPSQSMGLASIQARQQASDLRTTLVRTTFPDDSQQLPVHFSAIYPKNAAHCCPPMRLVADTKSPQQKSPRE